MKGTIFSLLLIFCAGAAYGQLQPKCEDVLQSFPVSCPNGSSCGTYRSFVGDTCNVDDLCIYLVPVYYCCQKYVNYEEASLCRIAKKMQDERYRSTILELAKYHEVLIPNCQGAYVPARLAFAHAQSKDAGTM